MYDAFNIAWPKSIAPPDLNMSLNFASPTQFPFGWARILPFI